MSEDIISPEVVAEVVAAHEQTGKKVARIAGRALRNPEGLTPDEIRMLAASCLTQVLSKKVQKS